MEAAVAVDWDGLLKSEMGWAIAQRREVQGEDEFKMRVKIVGPKGEVATTPFVWNSERHKHLVMKLVSEMCKMLNAQAAIIVSDTRFLNVPGFCKCFQIPEPGPGTWDAFHRERMKIMARFDYYFGNLPRETWDEALLVAIKGPRICRAAMTRYVNDGGKISFEPMNEMRDGNVHVGMLPTWWQ
jgi:hypothetical protein